MSFVKIYINSVWGTKSRFPYLTPEILPQVIDHIKQNAKKKNIFIDTIGGHDDHIHCLFCPEVDLSVSKALQLMKGESSFWINKFNITTCKFEWCDEYYAVSVDPSSLDHVRQYIKNQAEHHKKISYAEEVAIFLKEYNFNLQGSSFEINK